MTTRNDGTDLPSGKLEYSNNWCHGDHVEPGGSAQQQPYHRNEIEYPVMAPPVYDTAILETDVQIPLEEENRAPAKVLYDIYREPKNEFYNRSNDDETINMDETTRDKIDMYERRYPEDPESSGFGFSDASIRRGFIRKVYLILTVQLLITAGIISIFVFYKPAAAFSRSSFLIVILVFTIVLFFAIVCSGELRRKAPINYILLGLFTVTESLILGIISIKYRGDIVLMAMGMTAVICLGLTLFAFQTKFDFTFCGTFMFIAFLLLFVFGFAAFILHNNGENKKILYLLYASVGAIIFSIYLVADTQMMMAGNHKYSLSPEEYIFATLNLYIDVVYIFLYIIKILRYLDF